MTSFSPADGDCQAHEFGQGIPRPNSPKVSLILLHVSLPYPLTSNSPRYSAPSRERPLQDPGSFRAKAATGHIGENATIIEKPQHSRYPDPESDACSVKLCLNAGEITGRAQGNQAWQGWDGSSPAIPSTDPSFPSLIPPSSLLSLRIEMPINW
jgi:hypothetical protein